MGGLTMSTPSNMVTCWDRCVVLVGCGFSTVLLVTLVLISSMMAWQSSSCDWFHLKRAKLSSDARRFTCQCETIAALWACCSKMCLTFCGAIGALWLSAAMPLYLERKSAIMLPVPSTRRHLG